MFANKLMYLVLVCTQANVLIFASCSYQNDEPTSNEMASSTLSPTTTANATTVARSSMPLPLVRMTNTIRADDNDFGHAEVREGAFLFWWLYYADGCREDARTKPLVIWIQGGPSIPGSGLGNFVEIGPLTLSLKRRPHSWTQGKNVLFVDSPVGTGYSYVQNDKYCKTDKCVAADLVQLVKTLLEKFPQFKTTATHIFSQSYGTKFAVYFAYYLSQKISSGEMELDLKSVALGGSFIEPRTTMLEVPQFLYQTGFLDKPEYDDLRVKIDNLTAMLDREELLEAFKFRSSIISSSPLSYDPYNVFKSTSIQTFMQLENFMNAIVSPYLGPAFTRRRWSFVNHQVYDSLGPNFMKPASLFVEKILNETNVRVVVYNGDRDPATPIAGAVSWVHDLRWTGRESFANASRRPLHGDKNGFVKQHGRLSLWWILKAGHWVPTDNPEAMDQILEYIINDRKVSTNYGYNITT